MNYIKKIGLMLMVFMLLIVSINATQILVGDETSLPTIPADTFTERIFSKTFSTLQDETTQVLTGRIITDNAQQTLFTTQVLNELGNNTMTFLFSANSFVGGSPVFVTETFNLTPGSQKVMGVLSTINDEEFEISLRCTSGCSNATTNSYKVVFQTLDQEDESLSSSLALFVGFTADLIEINLSLWRLGFYLILFFVFLGFIGSIIFAILKAIEWAEKLGEKKKKHVYGGRSNN